MSEEPVIVKKKRRRRVRITRPVELRIGKRRFGVDGWELSTGILTYWVDGVHTLLPVTKKIEVRETGVTPFRGTAPATARGVVPEWMRQPDEEDAVKEIERRAAEFKRQKRDELSAMLRPMAGESD